ncbi:hypothetical protein [Tenacibaculum soleae]|uniref:hypothetical protein n=1 Tax=Tenacibaculum soleae TaxID=447689 RepID=UPI0026E2DAB8|nr:hypothetical protein [Tenacibaculum soleae]MDO6814068.1 hypothetical protein [Tenacibaculum soleae]
MNFFIISIFIITLIGPILLPNTIRGKTIWNNEESLFGKISKTSNISILITALFTFLYTIKPTYDFENIKLQNKTLKKGNKEYTFKNNKLIVSNKELKKNKIILESDLFTLKDSITTMSYELINLRRAEINLKEINKKLNNQNKNLGTQKDSLNSIKYNLEKRVKNLSNSVYLSSLNLIVKDITDYKTGYYGYIEKVKFHKIINEYFKRNPIKNSIIEKNIDYKNESKKIIKEYSKSIPKNENYSIEKVYESISYFLGKYYKL